MSTSGPLTSEHFYAMLDTKNLQKSSFFQAQNHKSIGFIGFPCQNLLGAVAMLTEGAHPPKSVCCQYTMGTAFMQIYSSREWVQDLQPSPQPPPINVTARPGIALQQGGASTLGKSARGRDY